MSKLSNIFNDTLKNASKLLLGTVVAQLIPIIFSFYFARVFSEAAFGFYGLYFGAVAIFVVVVNLKYDTAIMLPKGERDSNVLVLLSVALSFTIIL